MNDRTDDDVREREGADTGATETGAIEERARRIGWTPKDEFRGPSEKWMPADQFVEHGERLLPIVLERNRKLDDKLATSERELKRVSGKVDEISGQLTEAVTTFREFRAATANVEQRAYDRARGELQRERDAAVASADPAAFRAADQKLDELEKTKPAPPPVEKRREPEQRRADLPPPPQVSEETQQWIERNAWFKSDQDAGGLAVIRHGQNLAAGMSEAASLEKVEREIATLRPELFENSRRGAPPPVGAPSGSAPRKRGGNGRSFDDLPAEAKSAYVRFAKQDPKFTKEDYLRDYIWD